MARIDLSSVVCSADRKITMRCRRRVHFTCNFSVLKHQCYFAFNFVWSTKEMCFHWKKNPHTHTERSIVRCICHFSNTSPEMVWMPTMVCDTVMHQFYFDEKATKLRPDQKNAHDRVGAGRPCVCVRVWSKRPKNQLITEMNWLTHDTHTETERMPIFEVVYGDECHAYFGMWMCEQRRQAYCNLFSMTSLVCACVPTILASMYPASAFWPSERTMCQPKLLVALSQLEYAFFIANTFSSLFCC